MNADAFRSFALALPEAEEGAHQGTADFRVRGRIFATLRAEDGRAVVKLLPEQQEMMAGAEPAVFSQVTGGWGRQGWTLMDLAACDEATLRSALLTAWRNIAPKRLVAAAAP